jgi:hypothetical protein
MSRRGLKISRLKSQRVMCYYRVSHAVSCLQEDESATHIVRDCEANFT